LDRIEERFQKTLLPRKLEHHALQALRINPLNPADQLVEEGSFHSVFQLRHCATTL
jgi:hypothetical protein